MGVITTMEDYDVVGSYNNQRVTTIDPERSVNLFEYRDSSGKKPRSLLFTSGLKRQDLTFTDASGGFRNEYVFTLTNEHYFVIGNNVYRQNNLGVTKINTAPLNTTSGFVSIESNNAIFPQLIFVDGDNGYIYDTVNDLWQLIIDPAFPVRPIDVTYIDGFFVVANGNTNQFFMSTLNEGRQWGAAPVTTGLVGLAVTTNIGALPDQLILSVVGTGYFNIGYPVSLNGNNANFTGSGLATGITYYVIPVDATHIKLATTPQNSYAGIAITITANLTTGTPDAPSITTDGQLQQGAINSHPGNIVACRSLHRRVFLFSLTYIEVWENSGDGANLPLRRNNSYLIEYGTPALWSVRQGFDSLFFIGYDKDGLGSVFQINGVSPIPISTTALDYQLSQYAASNQISDASGILIKENGIIFYRLNFTAANHTFVYNVTMSNPTSGKDSDKLWHEEEMLDKNRHVAQTHAFFNGINYVGNYESPILYAVSNSYYTNDGESIRRMRITRPSTISGYQRRRVDKIQLDVLQGALPEPTLTNQNIVTDNGMNIITDNVFNIILDQTVRTYHSITPYIFFSCSKDGGQTYGYLYKSPMGQIGERNFRTVWRNLGVTPRGQAFVAKFEFYDPLPLVILGGAWATEVMPE